MNTGKQMIALFIVIGACLGIAAFVMVLTSKQSTKCKQNKEGYIMKVGQHFGDKCNSDNLCNHPHPIKVCKNSNCTDCSGWDLEVECDNKTKRCIAAPDGGMFYEDGKGYESGYLCHS